MTHAQMTSPALSNMASAVLKLQLVDPVTRLQGVRTLMQQHRKSGEIVFFNRLWDVYETEIVTRNSKIIPLSVEYETDLSLFARSHLFRIALHSDGILQEWKERTDQIVSLTHEELHDYTFGDFMEIYMDCEDDTFDDMVDLFCWEMSEKEKIRSIKSRMEGYRLLRSEVGNWTEEFQRTWDLYLVEIVRIRHDIWNTRSERQKQKRDHSCDIAVNQKRLRV